MELYFPGQARGIGVLVLAGSSGRVDTQRARLLADHGAVALPLRWFGGEGQQPGPWGVPIETFIAALDALSREADRLAIMGVSFGAEAALVTGSRDLRVDKVVAFAPSCVVWPGYDERHHRWTSHWTWRAESLPFVPIEGSFTSSGSPPSYLSVYRHALRVVDDVQRARATITVEKISEVLLVSGGDDRVWPSSEFASIITARRTAFGLDTRQVYLSEAGHRTILPGEQTPSEGRTMARGGNPAADAALGAKAWPHIRQLLGLA